MRTLTVNIPRDTFSGWDIEINNLSDLCLLLVANPSIECCVFNDINRDSDPCEYPDYRDAIGNLVTYWYGRKYSVGLRFDTDRPYFCIVVLPQA